MLSTLGHAILSRKEDDLVVRVETPVLVRLPHLGLPVAILCGARSPRAIQDLRTAAPQGVTITVRRPEGEYGELAPSRVMLKAPAEDDLARLAGDLGISYASTPACWVYARGATGIEDYVKSLRWEEGKDLNWERADFDLERLCFRRAVMRPAGLRLSRYRDPARKTWRYRIVRDGYFAEVDPDMGRYAILYMCKPGTRVLVYNASKLEVSVPLGMPLPLFYSRALALASGLPPERREVTGEKRGYYLVYREVPSWLFRIVARKLGQGA